MAKKKAVKKAAKKKTVAKKQAAQTLPSEEKKPTKRVKVTRGTKQRYLLLGALIGFLMGLALAGIVWQNYLSEPEEQELRTYCQVDILSLYGRTCSEHADCYGRAELCSPIDRVCVNTAAILNKNDPRNVFVPNNKVECELNGGIWTTEVVGAQNPVSVVNLPSTTPIQQPQELIIPLDGESDEPFSSEPLIVG